MTEKHTDPVCPWTPVSTDEFDAMAFEIGLDGNWRAYDQCGLVAVAPSFRLLFEKTGGRWN